MKTISYLDGYIYEKTWVIPFLYTGITLSLMFTIIYFDSFIVEYSKNINNFIAIDKVTSSAVLSVLASSTISVTSVIFSITILVLSNTSTKYGTRLLPMFMRQKTTQRVLGLFISTFIYCLISLFLMDSVEVDNNTIRAIVLLAVALGILCFLSLVVFINFICSAIQSDNILLYLSKDLHSSIKNYFNELADISGSDNGKELINITKKIEGQPSFELTSECIGYVTNIDHKAIMKFAKKHEIIISLEIKPGSFIFKNQPIAKIYYNNEADKKNYKKINDYVTTDNRRKHVQDIEFCFEELSEIALLALSPGVCNPYLAVHCVDRIMSGLIEASKHIINKSFFYDENKYPRLIIKKVSGCDHVDYSLSRIRQQSTRDVTMIIHLIKSINKVYNLIDDQDMKISLFNQVNDLISSLKLEDFCEHDYQTIMHHYSIILTTKENTL